MHPLYAHIAGIPVEEMAIPILSTGSVGWVAMRLLLRRAVRRDRSGDPPER